jgi:cell division protein FtsQ
MTPLFLIIVFVLITKLIYTYTYTNNLFDNYKIKINGNKHVKNTLIINKIFSNNNSSILNVNMIEIQKRLEEIEYIHTAQVSQILPNSLIINIIERSPTVLINKPNKSVFMDSHGILLPINEKSIINFPVPVLSIKDEKMILMIIKTKLLLL